MSAEGPRLRATLIEDPHLWFQNHWFFRSHHSGDNNSGYALYERRQCETPPTCPNNTDIQAWHHLTGRQQGAIPAGVDHEAGQIAVLMPYQRAVHVYGIGPDNRRQHIRTISDIRFQDAVDVGLHSGRLDVICKDAPYILSYNLDGSGITAPTTYCRAAASTRAEVTPPAGTYVRARADLRIQHAMMTRAYLQPGSSAVGGNDEFTVLKISSDTYDGDTTFADTGLGPNCPHGITAFGNVKHSTDYTLWGQSWIKFDGVSYLRLNDSTDWWVTDEYTIDTRVLWASVPTAWEVLLGHYNSSYNQRSWILGYDGSTNELKLYYSLDGASGNIETYSWTPSVDTPYFIAAVRDSADYLSVYIDNIRVIYVALSSSGSWFNSNSYFTIGCNLTGSGPVNYLNAYLKEARLSKGVARFAGATITVPSGPYDEGDTPPSDADQAVRLGATLVEHTFEEWDRIACFENLAIVGTARDVETTGPRSFQLSLLDRETLQSIWNKELKTVIGDDGLGYEPCVSRQPVDEYLDPETGPEVDHVSTGWRSGYTTHVVDRFYPPYYDLALFRRGEDVSTRIGLARAGTAYGQWGTMSEPDVVDVSTLDEYDLGLGDGRSVMPPILATQGAHWGAGVPLVQGLHFKRRDPYDYIPGSPERELCYFGLKGWYDTSEWYLEPSIRGYQRSDTDTEYAEFYVHTQDWTTIFPGAMWLASMQLLRSANWLQTRVEFFDDRIAARVRADLLAPGYGGLWTRADLVVPHGLLTRVKFFDAFALSTRAVLTGDPAAQFWAWYVLQTQRNDWDYRLLRMNRDGSFTVVRYRMHDANCVRGTLCLARGQKIYFLQENDDSPRLACHNLFSETLLWEQTLTASPENLEQTAWPAWFAGRIFYLSGDRLSLCYVWEGGGGTGYYSVEDLLPDYEDLQAVASDEAYLYVLARKGEVGGLWLVTLNALMQVTAEVQVVPMRTHLGLELPSLYGDFDNLQIQAVDPIHRHIILTEAGVAYDTSSGSKGGPFGPMVVGIDDGQLKWWANERPAAVVLHHWHPTGTVYLLPGRYPNHAYTRVYSPLGTHLADLAIGDVITHARAVELWIDQAVRTRVKLIETRAATPPSPPASAGPRKTPIIQRFN